MGWQINQNLIPEPTTATLSLLALAGLAPAAVVLLADKGLLYDTPTQAAQTGRK